MQVAFLLVFQAVILSKSNNILRTETVTELNPKEIIFPFARKFIEVPIHEKFLYVKCLRL